MNMVDPARSARMALVLDDLLEYLTKDGCLVSAC